MPYFSITSARACLLILKSFKIVIPNRTIHYCEVYIFTNSTYISLSTLNMTSLIILFLIGLYII